MSSAAVCPLCFIKSSLRVAQYQEMLEHLMLPSAIKFYGYADFIFSLGVGTSPAQWHIKQHLSRVKNSFFCKDSGCSPCAGVISHS